MHFVFDSRLGSCAHTHRTADMPYRRVFIWDVRVFRKDLPQTDSLVRSGRISKYSKSSSKRRCVRVCHVKTKGRVQPNLCQFKSCVRDVSSPASNSRVFWLRESGRHPAKSCLIMADIVGCRGSGATVLMVMLSPELLLAKATCCCLHRAARPCDDIATFSRGLRVLRPHIVFHCCK